jgi:formylglycine-generating enzyme required for sulfatase activity
MPDTDVKPTDVKTLKEWVYARYVDFSKVEDIDEEAAIRALDEHFRKTPFSQDKESCYLGLLYLGNAMGTPEKRRTYLARAKVILDRWKERSGESWDIMDDALLDAEDALAKFPEPERKAALDKAAKEYADTEEPAPGEAGGDAAAPGMVLVPQGPFLSGPQKSLKETGAFWVDTFPVTNEQYAAFCQATGYRHPKFWAEGRLRTPRAPVVGVSWFDAYKYAAWAGKALPTREQWEKAARGKSGRIYPWGENLDHSRAVYGQPDGTDAVAEVGKHPENASEYGARDMVGNVWEWTDTWDPADPEMRLVLGGSWCDPGEFLRLDAHLSTNPKDKYDNIGFRCVRTAE